MKIIAVDDDKIALELLRECLQGAERESVRCETSPIKALREIDATETPYDCILLDIEMPEMSGTTLCAKIRELDRYQNTPILMITRKRSRTAVEQAFAKGATDFITKPFDFLEVQTRIRIAERLVQERQAALDSYMAAQNLSIATPQAMRSANSRRLYAVSKEEQLNRNCKNVINLSAFQNYLERIVYTGSTSIDLIALKVRRIHEIFAKSSAEEFVDFLEKISETTALHLRKSTTFLTHAGNGVFLAAFEHDPLFETEHSRKAILATLNELELPNVLINQLPLDIVIGHPLSLPEGSNLNFQRAVKVALSRMEQNEKILSDSNRLAVSY